MREGEENGETKFWKRERKKLKQKIEMESEGRLSGLEIDRMRLR